MLRKGDFSKLYDFRKSHAPDSDSIDEYNKVSQNWELGKMKMKDLSEPTISN